MNTIEKTARRRSGKLRSLKEQRRFRRSLRLENLEPRLALATILWDGGPTGTGTKWNEPINWAGDVLPGSADDAQIGSAFAGTAITSSNNVTIRSVTTAAPLQITAGTFTLGAATSQIDAALSIAGGSLRLNSATLNGLGTLTNTATVNLTASTVNTPLVNQGTLVAQGASTLNGTVSTTPGSLIRALGFPNTGLSLLTVAQGFTNEGTIELTGDSGFGTQFTIGNGTLTNAAGGTIRTRTTTGVTHIFVGHLDNRGALFVQGNVIFNKPSAVYSNSGTLNVNDGTLTVSNSGSNAAFTNSGNISIASGRTLSMSDSAFNQNAGTISGAGTMSLTRVTAGFGEDFNNGLALLTFSQSTLSSLGTITNLPGKSLQLVNATVNAAFLNQGTLLPTIANFNGEFGNAVGGLLRIDNGICVVANGFINHGTIEMTGLQNFSATLEVTNGTLTNAVDGTIRILQSGQRFLTAQLDNKGTLDATLGIQTPLFLRKPSASHTNSGNIRLTGGSFTIGQAGTGQSFTNTGVIDVGANGTLNVATVGMSNNESGILTGHPTGIVSISGPFAGSTTNSNRFTPQVTFQFNGPGSAANPQLLEVMGDNRGAIASGFTNNFAIGKLSLANTLVRLVDNADNSSGAGPEALYVDRLVVPSGTTLDLNSFKVYARQTQIQGTILGGTVTQAPDGGPISLNSTSAGAISASGEVDEWTFYGRARQAVTVIANPGASVVPAPLSPTLNAVDVRLLGPSGTILALNATITSGEPVALPNIELPGDGTYRVQVRAAAGGNQGNYVLTLANANIDTMPLRINQRHNGVLESEYSIDRWTFAARANQQVQFDWLNAAPGTIQFRLTGPNSFVGFSGLTGDSAVITLPVDGNYTLEATSGGAHGGNYAFQLVTTSPTFLDLGTPYMGTLVDSGQTQMFAVDIPEGQQLSLILNDNADGNRNELFAKFGSPPTRADHQFSATASSSSQRLVIPNAAPGTWHFLLFSERVLVPGTFTLTARTDNFVLSQVIPSRHGNGSAMVLTLSGAGFDSSTIVDLVSSGGTTFSANQVAIDSPTQLHANFAAGSVPPGVYSVSARTTSGGSAVLLNAFEVQAGSQGILETNLVLPRTVGRHALATIYVEYANTGSVAIPAPLLVLHATDRALLSLNDSSLLSSFWTSAVPDGYSDSVQILGSGATPGLLQPGEHIRTPVYFAGLQPPHDPTDNSVDFLLNVIDSDTTTPIDWESMGNVLRPSGISTEAWEPIYSNLTSQIGSTWGDYVSMLRDNAQYLGHIGQSVNDGSVLWSFELQQAIGFSPLPTLAAVTDIEVDAPGLPITFARVFATGMVTRYDDGPLGHGWAWTAGWQRRVIAEADGTVFVSGIDGRQRRFQPDSRFPGRYFSQPGDHATLTGLGSGVFQLREANGLLTRFRSDSRVDFIEDPNSNRITTTWNGAELTHLTHSAGQFLQIQYSGGRVASLSDHLGRTVTYSYDSTGEHLLNVSGINGQTTHYTYMVGAGPALEHALSSIEYPDQSHELFTYDARGRLASIARDNNAERLTLSYDSAGRVTTTDALNGSTMYFFNHQGGLGAKVDALGRRTLFDYDNNFNLRRVTDASGQNYLYDFDNRGNLTRSTNPLGQVTVSDYTTDFNRLAGTTDARGNSLRYGYDNRGNVTSTTYADGSIERFVWDARGELNRWTNRRGQLIDYLVNADGRLERRTLPDGSLSLYHYNARGNVDLATDATGTTVLEYLDPQNPDLPTKITFPNGQFLTYAYQDGRRTRMVDQDGFTTNYLYDVVGRMDSLRDSSGNLIVQYHYDAVGRLQREDHGNGTFTEYQYDLSGQLEHLLNKAPGGSISSRFDYVYDQLGRRIRMSTLEGEWAYTYDAIGQLTRAKFTSNNPTAIPHQDLQYVYDAAGNRTRTIINGVTTDYTANNLNQYTQIGAANLTYDLDGNLIARSDANGSTSYVYNALNQLTGTTAPGNGRTYHYDVFDNRISTIHNGQRTDYLIDPFGLANVVGEFGDSGSLIAHFTHGLGLTSRVDSSGAASFYGFDGNANVVQLSGTGGTILNSYRYLPFGQTLAVAEAVPNPFTFVGQFGVMNDNQELHFMRRRWYDPRSGQFTAPDPIGLNGGDANLYRYVSNDPLNQIDPSGLIPGYYPTEEPPAPPKKRPQTVEGADLSFVPWISLDQCNDFGGIAVRSGGKAKDLFGEQEYCLTSLDEQKCTANRGAIVQKKNFATCYFFIDQSPEHEPIHPHSPPPLPPPGPGPGAQTETVTSGDPNEKTGPAGYGAAHFVAVGQSIAYRIDFENDATATAPAQRVVITDQLDPNLDWDTFGWTEIGFGDVHITIPSASRNFQAIVPMSYNGRNFQVEIELSLDSSTGLLTAVIQSIDPATFLPPDVLTGMLPPEDGTGRGQGHVSYTIQPNSGLSSGTEIRNVALITFDVNEIIATNQVDPHDPAQGTDPDRETLITIDAGLPTSSVGTLPTTSQTRINVSWNGSDDPNGSGVAMFDIFVSIDGAPFVIWLDDTTRRFAQYQGQLGHSYAFYSAAKDNVGHEEGAPSTPDAMTFVNALAGDFNADNVFDCSDINQLVAAVAAGSGDPTFDLTGDQLLTLDDVAEWLSLAGGASLPSGNPYRFGDANLDGVVDGSDFGIWNAHKFTSSPAWCHGDFSADGVVDGSDFGIWNANKFQSANKISMDATWGAATWRSAKTSEWFDRKWRNGRKTSFGATRNHS